MLNNLIFSSPGSVAFNIGSWPVRWYGVFIAIGFLVAYFFAEKLIKKNNLDLNCFNDLIFFVLIFSVVFARVWFVVLSFDYFKDHLSEIPKIWYGGQSIHGGIFGAVLAVFLYSKIKKISFYDYMDVIAVVAPLGQAIGRWGNFFNNEAFGIPVETGFSCLVRLYIPQEFRPDKYLNNQYFHPTFLYESVFDFLIFVFLWRKYPDWKNKPGKIFWVYLLGYSVIRFFLEFLRVDSLYLFGNIASAHFVSGLIVIISMIMLCRIK